VSAADSSGAWELPHEFRQMQDTARRFMRERVRPAEAPLPHDAYALPEEVLKPLQEEAKKLPEKLGDAAGALQSIAAGAFDAAFQLLTILTMTFFLLLDGKRMARFLVGRFGGDHKERLLGVIGRIYRSTAGYVAGALTISSINGILTFCMLTILGVPFAIPLSVLMAFFGLIPLVGATIGGVVIGAVTAFTDFPTATIVWVIVLLVYQQVENNVLQPIVYRRTVQVAPLLTIVAVLIGATLLGVLGVLIAIPIAGAIQIVVRDVWNRREPSISIVEQPGTT